MSQCAFTCVVFDLDGVVTATAKVHSTAWKQMFDDFMREEDKKTGKEFQAFRHHEDYLPYVDGKPRYKGVQSFLESRGYKLEFGDPSDTPDKNTCCGLGNRKDRIFNEILARDGVEVYQSTVDFIKQVKALGVHVGVASSSKNCEGILKAAKCLDLFETRVDGVVSAELGLKGKPEADIFTVAADRMGCSYDKTIVVEDATSGVQAGLKGNFGLVLGIARENNAKELYVNGADIVVTDFSEITLERINQWFNEELPVDMWTILYKDYDPIKERTREALTSVGNGYFGTRGCQEEQYANKVNQPGTYQSGIFNRAFSTVGDREIENEDFVNTPNWLYINFKTEGNDWLDLNKAQIVDYKKRLCLRSGVLQRHLVVQDSAGNQTEINSRRFASFVNPNFAAIRYAWKPLNYDASVQFRSGLEGRLKNTGVDRYNSLNQQHLEPVNQFVKGDIGVLEVTTIQSRHKLVQGEKVVLFLDGKKLQWGRDVPYTWEVQNGAIFRQFSVNVAKGSELVLIKYVSLYNSLATSGELAGRVVKNLKAVKCYHHEENQSAQAWQKLWERADVQVIGDRLSQKLIRLHIYHLFVTWSQHSKDIDFAVPARGLTGESYRGHIFWDELYFHPFYTYHVPEATKATFIYRYKRLEAARNLAKQYNYEGAMFPWQSGSTGREETQIIHLNPLSGKWDPDYSCLQRHVNLALQYNIWTYYDQTHDHEFLAQYGAELFLDISRFWASKCEFDQAKGKYFVKNVMGPDEYHEHGEESPGGGTKNNAYTNLMTLWALQKSFEIIAILKPAEYKEVAKKLILSAEEVNKWRDVLDKMELEVSPEGILEQFKGYFKLPELEMQKYVAKYGVNVAARMDRVLKMEGLTPDHFKVAKQADTLMTFYNISENEVKRMMEQCGYKPHPKLLQVNYEYYLPRTSHGSTLSRVVHCYLATQFGNDKLAWEFFQEALTSDYIDIQGGTTQEGIHTGVMGATVLIVLKAYAGLTFENGVPKVKSSLPAQWRGINFKITYRGKNYTAHITRDNAEINLEQ